MLQDDPFAALSALETAAGIAAGLKKNGRPDLGLIYSETTATAAASMWPIGHCSSPATPPAVS